ncbi:MAG: UDP-N-acetylmuramoyl-L-alanine--D-glutamate ligase, partial [Acidimicrobiia bacterium]|nr:UDP-N-acetylmuramoyl-L-alanine--D-glutamate ligase [Acidimicrobiia bacterium]
MGLRATGAVVAEWLHRRGDEVTVVEERPGQPGYAERRAALEAEGMRVIEGRPDWDTLVAGVDLLVPSPGVRPDHPVMTAARRRGVVVRGDLDLAVEAATVPVVVVTGTNGKSTVTMLISAMVEASGRRAPAVGNIGRVALEALAEPADVLVIEASSFQLHTVTPTFAPAVAVLLNLADDHLDWHGSFAAYVADKQHAFQYQDPDGVVVANLDDLAVVDAVRDAPGRVVGFALATTRPGTVTWVHGRLLDADG